MNDLLFWHLKMDYIILMFDHSMQLLLSRERFEDNPMLRFNDGKPDCKGRLWIGTMHVIETEENRETGTLYCFCNELNVFPRQRKVSVSNGLCWSLDNTKMYYIDSPLKEVYQYDFDVETGEISNRRVIIRFHDKKWGYPDGMTIDNEGMLWIACWEGACVTRWNPDTGEILSTIVVPAYKVTCVTFGGEEGNTLYITTARINLSNEILERYPLSGSLFCIKNAPYYGTPTHRAKINVIKNDEKLVDINVIKNDEQIVV